MTMTEPRIAVAHREHLWWLLAEAAQSIYVLSLLLLCHCNVFAASRTCSGRAITKKFSVTIRQRIVPDESTRNSAGRAISLPLASSCA